MTESQRIYSGLEAAVRRLRWEAKAQQVRCCYTEGSVNKAHLDGRIAGFTEVLALLCTKPHEGD